MCIGKCKEEICSDGLKCIDGVMMKCETGLWVCSAGLMSASEGKVERIFSNLGTKKYKCVMEKAACESGYSLLRRAEERPGLQNLLLRGRRCCSVSAECTVPPACADKGARAGDALRSLNIADYTAFEHLLLECHAHHRYPMSLVRNILHSVDEDDSLQLVPEAELLLRRYSLLSSSLTCLVGLRSQSRCDCTSELDRTTNCTQVRLRWEADGYGPGGED